MKRLVGAFVLAAHAADLVLPAAAPLRDWIQRWLDGRPPENVWLGTTTENQPEADRRVPVLLTIAAAVHFVSAEPLLGSLDLIPWLDIMVDSVDVPGYPAWTLGPAMPSLDLVIAGGETGPHARPTHPDWPRSLRDQCLRAGVAFFFKHWGEWVPEDQFAYLDAYRGVDFGDRRWRHADDLGDVA